MLSPSNVPSRAQVAGVYLLTPDAGDAGFADVLSTLAQALDAGVRIVQYRNKRATAEQKRDQALRAARLVHAAGATLIVNDDPQLALDVGADGVHLGREDGDLAKARAHIGERLLGASCYDDVERARVAVEGGVDAIAFGSVFASPTKPAAVRAPLDLLGQARQRWPGVRVIAIGGIGVDNISDVAAAGAHAAALMSAVFDADKPADAVRRLIEQFNAGLARYGTQGHGPQRSMV